ncbi:MAG TPA: DUF4432 family protein [Thermomicrobiales bacterium]|jgi:hypothetical protein|nr:DUF4432 family protein [Thermomicrobiales bacterium]
MVLTGRWRPQRNWGCRIHEGSTQGLRTITLENRSLRITFLLDRGADLVELLYKPQDLDFAWLTAGGVKDPRAWANSSPDLSATFHDYYAGGWQEPFPNMGVPATVGGAQFGQHGEAPTLPWDVTIVEDNPEAVAVRFSVRTPKMPFLLERTVSLRGDGATFRFDGRAVNESDVELHAMWGHHVTFGQPFLHPGVRITLPDGVRTFVHPGESRNDAWLPAGTEGSWPQLPANPGAPADAEGMADLSIVPPPGSPGEMCYHTGFDADAWYRVESDRHGAGAEVRWDGSTMPYLWHWHEYGAGAGYFAWGRHYNIGLEPATSWSPSALPGAIDNGTALTLPPRGERTHWLEFEVYPAGER